MIQCDKCNGKCFLDRTFSDNRNFEVFCLLCGKRTFVSKTSHLGRWLQEKEHLRTWGF